MRRLKDQRSGIDRRIGGSGNRQESGDWGIKKAKGGIRSWDSRGKCGKMIGHAVAIGTSCKTAGPSLVIVNAFCSPFGTLRASPHFATLAQLSIKSLNQRRGNPY